MSGLSTVLSLAFLLTLSVSEASSPRYLWSDTKGFVPLEGCRIAPLSEAPFKVMEAVGTGLAANLISSDGRSSLVVENRSLVKTNKALSKPGLEAVQIVGVPTSASPNHHPTAKVRNQGYLATNALQDLGNYVLEIKAGTPQTRKWLTSSRMTGTFWQLSLENDRPLSLLCSSGGTAKSLILFDVYAANQQEPIAQVGIDPKQISIFEKVQIHSVDEADQVLDSRMENPPENHRQSLVAGGKVPTVSVSSPLETIRNLPTKKEAPEVPALKLSDAKVETKPVAAGKEQTIESIIEDSESDSGEEVDEEEAEETIDSDMEYVVCINEDTLAVRDDSLEEILFRAERNETVLPVQSWDEKDAQKKTIDETEYTFIKVKFPERNGKNIGWLAQEYVRLEGQCPVPKAEKEEEQISTPVIPQGVIKNINSASCCGFPTVKRPNQSYLTGMRRFKAGRSKGRRLHAACDLYRVHGETAVSVAPGKVVNGLYKFYQGTYALEIQHPGGFVARYGELTGKKVSSMGAGKNVKLGQVVGHIGTVNSGCCKPMLHFELYSGTKKGSLSRKGNKFQRRTDLIDPSSHLRKWEKLEFGSGY